MTTVLFGSWSVLQEIGGKDEGQEVVTLLADLSSLLQGLFFYQVFSLMILVLPHQTVFLSESPHSSCYKYLERKQQGKLCKSTQMYLNLG